ncbi:nitrilase [Corynespora cassiicola Philippines]|uniref:Nitrilase n=1 Tax=Corynespora cassiicola Philippines TaxID=1448308 RepID=A0A2T2N5P0_CORCC|nr:nitrilase [Corynespora cassiicola Philippines]
MSTLRVAACHAVPVFLKASETTRKAITLVRKAAKNGANLIVFPETFIPAFPLWSALRPPTENHHLFQLMASESILASGPEITSLRSTAKELGIMISIGFSERAAHSTATLYNSNIIIGEDGEVLVHHRKLMPTFFEKLTWAPGDGHGLRIAQNKSGAKIGNLICGENTNPLARYSLMAQGEQVHISTWPAAWPTRAASPPNDEAQVIEMENDQQEVRTTSSVAKGANYDNVTANRTRAAAHCFEAKCFGVMCSGALDDYAIAQVVSGSPHASHLKQILESAPRGATMFLDPTGAPLPGFTIDEETGKEEEKEFLQSREGILYADLDLRDCVEGKQYHDVVGGYQRLDVFKLSVDRSRREPVVFEKESERNNSESLEL